MLIRVLGVAGEARVLRMVRRNGVEGLEMTGERDTKILGVGRLKMNSLKRLYVFTRFISKGQMGMDAYFHFHLAL